ncbi:MAG: tRNA (adenosine(37)-N6)-dimethylallyltransferase MiaA [Bacteroidales bacterium]
MISKQNQKHLVVIAGPTAVGKTELCIELAESFGTEIISADSRQIFKEMKIGTAKPTHEELKKVKHHFIDYKTIHEFYTAGMFELDVMQFLEKYFQKNDLIIMTGGSGLYINAVCEGIDALPRVEPEIRSSLIKQYNEEGIESLRYSLKKLDPASYDKIDLKNPKRILKALEITIQTGKPYSSFLTKTRKKRTFNIHKIGLTRDRQELYERINDRVDKMIEEGLVEEARNLHQFKHLNPLNTVGYKELFDYFDGKIPFKEAIRLIKRNSRRYAKRQMTWFSRDPEIKWFNSEQKEEIKSYIKKQTTICS